MPDHKDFEADHVDSATLPLVAGKSKSELILCYLTCPTDAANSFTGAVMLTDYRARPQHFAYVLPVKPSKMQKLLYGATLDEYVKIDVICQKLYLGLPKKPDVIFVETADLLPARILTKLPTANLTKNTNSNDVKNSLSTVIYKTDGDDDMVGTIVNALELDCDLIEPFARLRLALTEAINANKQVG